MPLLATVRGSCPKPNRLCLHVNAGEAGRLEYRLRTPSATRWFRVLRDWGPEAV